MNRKWLWVHFFALLVTVCSLRALAQDTSPGITQWPLRIESAEGTITMYEPQPTKFEGNTLTARAAVSLTPTGTTDPEFGALWFGANVFTDRDARLVTIQNIAVKQVKLPNSAGDAEAKFTQVIQQQIPQSNVVLSLDQLEATLGVVQKAKEESQQLQNTPPKIIFTTTPTTLVVLDGPPKLQATATPSVMSVVNTPFILLFDLGSKTYFLKAGETWMAASDVTGPWKPAGNMVPVDVSNAGIKLTSDNAAAGAAAKPQASIATQILVAEEPTEVIASDGPPTYATLPTNDLLYMSNTQSDVFMDVSSQQYFVLLAGRWYTGPKLDGPWAFVASDQLPAAFAQIPADSPKANVLVSVAGTQNAKDARLDTFIPQTTAIQRNSGANLTVAYDGEPQFVPVENTPITYANNCADPVLFVQNSYYCCHQAVWYRGQLAVGPWEVCTSVPQVIYTLPPSCPVYNCRYCYVYDSTPDVVYCGYLPGYTGCYVYGPTVVYGTGYRYSSWYHTQYIPRSSTWGFAPRYDYHAGTWGFGAAVSFGPSWFAARPERHNWWGPQGYVDYRSVHSRYDRDREVVINNNRTEVHNVTVNRINIYNRPENARRNFDVHRNGETNNTHGNFTRVNTPNRADDRPAENNVYAGHDGQVYRRTNQGWEGRDSKGWSQIKNVPDASPADEPAVHTGRTPQHSEPTPTPSAPQHNVPRSPPQPEPHKTPTHITPQDSPAHIQTPVHGPSGGVAPPVEHPRQPSGGLEDDHAARQRGGGGSDRPNGNSGSADHSGSPAQHSAPGGSSDRGNGGGGNSGGGNKSGSGNGAGNKGK